MRLVLAKGEQGAGSSTLRETVQRLEAMGYARVPTVTEVAQFSIRGGILDVYGFGMAAPARLEWWGDDVSSIRGFDLTTQRSLQEMSEITVLPITTQAVREEAEGVAVNVAADAAPLGVALSEAKGTSPEAWSLRSPQGDFHAGPPTRRTLLELLPSDTIVIEEAAGPDRDEVQRGWNE